MKDVGLCMSLWDILSVSEMGQIFAGDPSFYLETKFRLLVFRPLIGEIFRVKVVEIDEIAIRCSTEFFEDIWLPMSLTKTGTTL